MDLSSLEKALREYVGSRTLFTISAYGYMAENVPTNCVISSLSAESYLTSISLGARGQTAEEIKEKFDHLPCDNEKLANALGSVLWNLSARSCHRFQLPAKIYVSRNYEVEPLFRRLVEIFGKGKIENVDFNTAQCASAMNNWVKSQITEDFQKKISDDMLTANTKMVLVNGVNFKGKWKIGFTKQPTPMQFSVSEQESIPVVSIANKWRHNYYHFESLKAKIVDIDFESINSDCSLVLIVPDEVDGLAGIEENISSVFDLKLQLFDQTTIELELPIFKIETMIDFKEIFNRADIHKVFNEDEADLTGISDGQGLYLNNFFQKIFFDLNEEGINADDSLKSAGPSATVLASQAAPTTSNTPRDAHHPYVKADRPFAFYIKIRNAIVMIGRVLNPIS